MADIPTIDLNYVDLKPHIPFCKMGKPTNPIHKQLPLDPKEFEREFEPKFHEMLIFRYSSDFKNSLDQSAVPFTEGTVPPFLLNIVSPDELQRLAPSVLQIRAEPRTTMLRLSPSYGVMSLTSTLALLNAQNWPRQYATATSLGTNNSTTRIKFDYDFYYNYEHLKNWMYKDRDVHNLTLSDDNQQNDLAFLIFRNNLIKSTQTFFLPTSKTWDLHNSEAFIFAYPSLEDTEEEYQQVFPGDRKVLKPGTVKFKLFEDGLESSNPPIVGLHTCGAVAGMEGCAIVSMQYPCELIGIHVAGVHQYFKGEPGVDYNYFVSVHHPRFVQYYVETIIPDLHKHAKDFLRRNCKSISAYLQVHGYKLDDIIPQASNRRRIIQYNSSIQKHTTTKNTDKKKSVILKQFN